MDNAEQNANQFVFGLDIGKAKTSMWQPSI